MKLAFFDSFAGLIPCKVLSVKDTLAHVPELAGRSSSCILVIELTARRGAYRRGEKLTGNALNIVPRSHVFTRGGRYMIRGGYQWSSDTITR